MKQKTETVVLGGGCFWCLEAIFKRVRGVVSVESGYAGGDIKNPTYAAVCSGETGHAEVVKVEYEPDVIPFGQLMRLFFGLHDPTTLNQQGADVGTQYRSVIFWTTQAQGIEAGKIASQIPGAVTEILPLEKFYPAEDYHQRYYELNRDKNPYCRLVIDPRIRRLLLEYKDWTKN